MHIGPRPKTTLGTALILALALAGCGGSGSKSQSSATQAASSTQTTSTTTPSTTSTTSTTSTPRSHVPVEHIPTPNIQLTSSVPLHPIPARYTCDGANISPPIAWSNIPPNTAEIDLFLFNLEAVHGRLIPDWAVVGLRPTLRKLSAGQLPPGAILGRNGQGQARYSLCPPKGPSVHYAFLLYALPHRIPARPGFAVEALRKKAQLISESEGLLLSPTYKRR